MSEETPHFLKPEPGQDIDWFINVAAKSGEVDRADVVRGCERAEYLLWIGEAAAPLSVAVLKNPKIGYKTHTFEKAQIPGSTSHYRYEFGYAFTEVPYRRRRCGERLLQESLRPTEGHKVYATARTDNDVIHRLLLRTGFERSGKDYPSERTPCVMLALFLR